MSMTNYITATSAYSPIPYQMQTLCGVELRQMLHMLDKTETTGE
jgi:hypothetical protein